MLAGPNGAGKTTSSRTLIRDTLHLLEFVNADVIAQGLSAFSPDQAALAAGRIMLTRLHELAEQRISFAFETTLASRSFATWIQTLIGAGYQFELFYFWLKHADLAVARVADRVRRGGHHVPEEAVRRRYDRGLRNFFNLYMPLASTWRIYDNSGDGPMKIASGEKGVPAVIADEPLWAKLRQEYGHERADEQERP